MFTTRQRPKISEKPLATMNRSAASVNELSSVVTNWFGLWTAEPKLVLGAQNRIHTSEKTTAAPTRIRAVFWRVHFHASCTVMRARGLDDRCVTEAGAPRRAERN